MKFYLLPLALLPVLSLLLIPPVEAGGRKKVKETKCSSYTYITGTTVTTCRTR